MSTAAVSGAVATLLSSSGNQNLTPDQVKARLMKTASKFPKNSRALITDSTTGQVFHIVYDAFTVGAGYLDLDSALVSNATTPSRLTNLRPRQSLWLRA